MPCRGPDDHDCKAFWETEANLLAEQVDQLEGMLCETLQLLEEKFGNSTDMRIALNARDVRIVNFIVKHEAEEAPKIRAEAAKKLSERERRALGIDMEGNPKPSLNRK